jgi:hypothetical protein
MAPPKDVVKMAVNAQDFMAYWVANCVHAEGYPRKGDRSLALELESRCIAMAADEGLTKAQLENAVGTLPDYINANIVRVNDEEAARLASKSR